MYGTLQYRWVTIYTPVKSAYISIHVGKGAYTKGLGICNKYTNNANHTVYSIAITVPIIYYYSNNTIS